MSSLGSLLIRSLILLWGAHPHDLIYWIILITSQKSIFKFHHIGGYGFNMWFFGAQRPCVGTHAPSRPLHSSQKEKTKQYSVEDSSQQPPCLSLQPSQHHSHCLCLCLEHGSSLLPEITSKHPVFLSMQLAHGHLLTEVSSTFLWQVPLRGLSATLCYLTCFIFP